MMDTSIKRDPRSNGKYVQKARFGQSKCKMQAFKDIQEECGGGFYTINYIMREYQVLKMPSPRFNIIPLNI